MSSRSELRADALARAFYQCQWPECSVVGDPNLQMSHLIQLSQGGPDSIDNIVMLCGWHHDILDGRSTRGRRNEVMKLLRAYRRGAQSYDQDL